MSSSSMSPVIRQENKNKNYFSAFICDAFSPKDVNDFIQNTFRSWKVITDARF